MWCLLMSVTLFRIAMGDCLPVIGVWSTLVLTTSRYWSGPGGIASTNLVVLHVMNTRQVRLTTNEHSFIHWVCLPMLFFSSKPFPWRHHSLTIYPKPPDFRRCPQVWNDHQHWTQRQSKATGKKYITSLQTNKMLHEKLLCCTSTVGLSTCMSPRFSMILLERTAAGRLSWICF